MKKHRPALKVEADYRILVDPYIPPLPPGPAARWRRWLVITGIVLLLAAAGTGAWWLVQRAGKPVPGPAAAPVAASNVTAEAEAAPEPEIPELPPGIVEAPGAGEEPEAPACLGGIVVQVQAPVAARTYLQNTAKRLRLETNAWTSIPTLPHILTNQVCGMAEVGFEALGFRSEPASRRILVQEGRTNDANFTLHALPATLLLTCNATNAEIRITNHVARIPDPVSVPSLQPVTLTVSAPGFRAQTLTLGAFDPLTTNRQAVTLEREVGALRIEAEVPTNALAYFQGLEKRIRISSNDWETVNLPHMEEGLDCVETPVELAVIGFGTANERELTRMKVEDGRTNTVVFRLQPLPATLTITCNVTNAEIRITNHVSRIAHPVSIPSLQPVSVTVSATGYVAQTLALGPYNPLTTNSTAMKLEPEAKPEPPPAAAAPAGKPGETMTVDLGGGVKMELVWIEALKMWVGKYEVTNAEYRRMKPDHDSKDYQGQSLNGDRQPVVYVNFDDAKAYAQWLNEQLRGRLPGGYKFRLPSEQEWMTYAQCGDGREYPWGNNWPPRSGQAGNYHGEEGAGSWSKISNYRDGHPVNCAVEQSWANPWGLYGVGGNVWEACALDGTGGSFGAWRGASWYNYNQGYLRCSSRRDYDESYRGTYDGFRVVLSR